MMGGCTSIITVNVDDKLVSDRCRNPDPNHTGRCEDGSGHHWVRVGEWLRVMGVEYAGKARVRLRPEQAVIEVMDRIALGLPCSEEEPYDFGSIIPGACLVDVAPGEYR